MRRSGDHRRSARSDTAAIAALHGRLSNSVVTGRPLKQRGSRSLSLVKQGCASRSCLQRALQSRVIPAGGVAPDKVMQTDAAATFFTRPASGFSLSKAHEMALALQSISQIN